MSKSEAWKRYLHKLSLGAASLVLAVPVAVSPLAVAPVLAGQRAVAEIDCTHGASEVCKSIARDWCAANPEACRKPAPPAPSAPAAPLVSSEKPDQGAPGALQTLALDPPSGPWPARMNELDAADVAILAKLKADTWLSANEYLIVSTSGLASPRLAEFNVPLLQSGVPAGELTYRIYDVEANAMMYLDLATDDHSQRAITSWQVAHKGVAEPAKCLAVVQPESARAWTPFETKQVGPKDLLQSAGGHDWVRCFARRGAIIAIATVVVQHGEDSQQGPSQIAVKAAGNVAMEALWRLTPSAAAR